MAPKGPEDNGLVLTALKAMVAGAVQDRAAAFAAFVVALVLLLTAWVLAVAAVVQLVSRQLGPVGGLAAVAGGLVVLALAIVSFTRMRNRGASEQRAATRALWTATAVNAASAMLRRDPAERAEAAAPGESTGSGRSMLLVLGGVVLVLLGLFLPSGKDSAAADDGADPTPDPGAEPAPRPAETA